MKRVRLSDRTVGRLTVLMKSLGKEDYDSVINFLIDYYVKEGG